MEDLRIMIGQQTSLNTLVPMVLEVLEKDPTVEGDLYPGDLFASVTRIPDAYWQSHPEQKARLDRIVIPES